MILLLSACAHAATNLYLRTANSALKPPAGFLFKMLSDSAGTSTASTAPTSTLLGDVTGQEFATCAAYCFRTATTNGSSLLFVSKPISVQVTISGPITPNLWCLESANTANASLRYEVLHWSKATGGIVASLGISPGNSSSECPTTTATARTTPVLTPTDRWGCAADCHGQTWNVFSPGDRVVLAVFLDDPSGCPSTCMTASSRSVTLRYDWDAANTAASYVTFTETISLEASDTNNARPVGSSD